MEGLCYSLNTSWNVGVLELEEVGSRHLALHQTKTVHRQELLRENVNPEVAAIHTERMLH